MKMVGYVFSGFLMLTGGLLLVAAAEAKPVPRSVAGAGLLGAGLAMVYFLRMKLPEQKVSLELKLSGDVRLEDMKCRHCGAALDSKSVSLEAGAVFANCRYCGAHYQLEEAPKW